MELKICNQLNCKNKIHSKGYCQNHYNKNIFFKNHPLYITWRNMNGRCYNPKDKRYSDYGERGITVCRRWRKNYALFAADMGVKVDGTTLDRIDNNGNYELSNCRWASQLQQSRNRRVRHNSKSGVAGVTWFTSGSKWRAEITINKTPIYLGLFGTLELAIEARKKAELKYGF